MGQTKCDPGALLRSLCKVWRGDSWLRTASNTLRTKTKYKYDVLQSHSSSRRPTTDIQRTDGIRCMNTKGSPESRIETRLSGPRDGACLRLSYRPGFPGLDRAIGMVVHQAFKSQVKCLRTRVGHNKGTLSRMLISKVIKKQEMLRVLLIRHHSPCFFKVKG